MGVEMVAANKMGDGMEDFDGEVLHRSHIDYATQVREYSGEFRLKRENDLQLAVRLDIWIDMRNDSGGVR